MSIKLAQTLNQLAKSTEAMIHGEIGFTHCTKELVGVSYYINRFKIVINAGLSV